MYSKKQRTVHRTELVCQTPSSDITYYNMWIWMNKKLSESPTPSSTACIWTIHGCKGHTMRSEFRNSLLNLKDIQTSFDISKQKDGYVQLLVYWSSISSNCDCSELRVKKIRRNKKERWSRSNKQTRTATDLLNSGLHGFVPWETWPYKELCSVQGSTENQACNFHGLNEHKNLASKALSP